MPYIDKNALYEQTAKWEAQALAQVERTMNDEDKTEWKKWSIILKERSAFKFNVADASTADVVERKHGKWIPISDVPNVYTCSNCYQVIYAMNRKYLAEYHAFCGRCGADMRKGGAE